MKTKHNPMMVTWQTPESIQTFNQAHNAPYGQSVAEGEENFILSKHCQLGCDSKKTGLNDNIMVIGGPGTGKNYNVILPNLLQGHDSYVVLDVCGELLATTGKFFESRGYHIRLLNMMDMAHSHGYNPFRYLRDEKDIDTLIECLFVNLGKTPKDQDSFFTQEEKNLLRAIMLYFIRHQLPEMQTFSNLCRVLQQAIEQEQTLDYIFNEVRKQYRDDPCVASYDQFKRSSAHTSKTIILSLFRMLMPMSTEPLKTMMQFDDMDLETVGDQKSIIYLVVPAGPNPYSFLVSMLYSQIFDTLKYHAVQGCEGEMLKHHVTFLMDEFVNSCYIPNFEKTVSTINRYGLSCMIFLQAIGQFSNLYPQSWESAIQNFDTLLYLGGNEFHTMEYLLSRLSDVGVCENDGGFSAPEPVTLNHLKMGKRDHCIVLIRGEQPFYDEKYNTSSHPNIQFRGNLYDNASLHHG